MTAQSGPLPGYRSRFGGLWIDRLDACAELEARRRSGALDEEQHALLSQWLERGYVVLEQAVPIDLLAALNADMEDAWSSGHPRIYSDFFEHGTRVTEPIQPRHRDLHVKVLDLYAQLASARRVALAPRTLAFLRLLFEREPMAFQSLYFRVGSMQPMHQDTAYVRVHPPMSFVGSWVALENVAEGTGELEYYAGSHRVQEFLWDGRHKWMPDDHPEHAYYLEFLHEQARSRGLERVVFRPRAGDVLLWHADLVHGGSQNVAPGSTRRSLVSHFCPDEATPGYFSEMPHSDKRREPAGGAYCFARRWPADHDALPAPLPPSERARAGLLSRLRRALGHRAAQRVAPEPRGPL